MARPGSACPCAPAERPPRRHIASLPYPAGSDRGRKLSAEPQLVETTSAMLESGAIMLGTALVFVILFRKLKLGATLGYIVGGALIGPHLLGLIRDPEDMASISEIGIALLLFIVGLELQPQRLWRLRKDIFGLGLAQVVLCGLALSLFIHFALQVTPAAALAIGLPLALSSTA